MQPVTVGNFQYTKDEKGGWIYKAKESKSLKNDKPKYRELPQYKLQETIEQKSKDRFVKIMNLSVIEITKHIKENLK